MFTLGHVLEALKGIPQGSVVESARGGQGRTNMILCYTVGIDLSRFSFIFLTYPLLRFSAGGMIILCRQFCLHLVMPKYYETAGHVIAASVALPVVDIIAVALKFRIRRIQKQPWKADDWCLVPATVQRFP